MIRWRDRDTWGDRLRALLLCSWLGHKPQARISGWTCSRCRTYTPTLPYSRKS